MLEVFGVILGLLGLYFEYRVSIWHWLIGIIMPLCYMFVYYDSMLYADMAICGVYVLVGVFGWIEWGRVVREGESDRVSVCRFPVSLLLPLVLSGLVLFFVSWYVLSGWTDTPFPLLSGLTFTMSLLAYYMLYSRYAEQWLVWIVIDLLNSYIYFECGLYPTSALFLLYSVLAIFGYLNWLRQRY